MKTKKQTNVKGNEEDSVQVYRPTVQYWTQEATWYKGQTDVRMRPHDRHLTVVKYQNGRVQIRCDSESRLEGKWYDSLERCLEDARKPPILARLTWY